MKTLARLVIIAGAAASALPAAAQNPDYARSRVTEIQWPDQALISVSSNVKDRFAGADRTLLPILVPRPFLKNRSLTFVGEPLHYSVSVAAKGANFSITGTRLAVDVPGEAPAAGSDEMRVTVGDQSAEAAITRYGAAYLVTVECNKASDVRCQNGDFASALLRSVDLVGGGRGGAAQPPAPPPALDPATIPVKSDPNFKAEPPGALLSGSGRGVTSSTIYAPGIRFPVSKKPVYLNSQVWSIGGSHGPRGGWSDPRNYAFPWRDNFCEARPRQTPLCPGGKGHQGVDIRPSVPKNDHRQMAVAVEPGRITKVGSYSVTLIGDSGTRYNYLHLRNVGVTAGQRVTAGQSIGLISNNFGGTPTTYHLHFEMMQNRNGRGWVHVPPYTSLVAAYERM